MLAPPKSPLSNAMTPRRPSPPPIPSRTPLRIGRSIATSRRAATGGTRAALRAGTIEDNSVTMVPTSIPMMTALAGTTAPEPGRSMPSRLITHRSPIASAMPPKTPIADAITPMTSDSPMIEPSTCRVLAPIARSNAISRVRCATTIENVL